MSTVIIELPPHREQTDFNLRRWTEVMADPEWVKIPGRIETDRYGNIIMSPPPAPKHGNFQAEVAHLLRQFLPQGRTVSECPISTADGVKAADVAVGLERTLAGISRASMLLARAGNLRGNPLAEKFGSRNSRENGALF